MTTEPEMDLPSRRRPIADALNILANLTTIAAAGIAAIGIGVWIEERQEREEEREARREERIEREAEREARRIGLIGQAQAAIAAESADGEFRSSESPLVQWALATLQTYEIPIFIVAKDIHIEGEALTCANVLLQADSVTFGDAYVRNSNIRVKARNFYVRTSALIHTRVEVGDDAEAHTASIAKSEIEDVFWNDLSGEAVLAPGTLAVTAVGPSNLTLQSSRARHFNVSTGALYVTFLVGPDEDMSYPTDICTYHQLPGHSECRVGTDKPAEIENLWSQSSETWLSDPPGCERPKPVRFSRPYSQS